MSIPVMNPHSPPQGTAHFSMVKPRKCLSVISQSRCAFCRGWSPLVYLEFPHSPLFTALSRLHGLSTSLMRHFWEFFVSARPSRMQWDGRSSKNQKKNALVPTRNNYVEWRRWAWPSMYIRWPSGAYHYLSSSVSTTFKYTKHPIKLL